MTISVRGDGYEAFLVVDSIMNETSSGGVRISHDIELEEIRSLAREMTFKYSLFRLPRGGAKMGIRFSKDVGPGQHENLLHEIGSKLGPIIRQGIYYPGMDMNCGPTELRAIYAGAGLEIGEPTDTSLFTALSVENAIEAYYEQSRAKEIMTVAIEGFGRVGGHLATQLDPKRYRIVALSTMQGAVKNAKGFDGRELSAQRNKYCDRIVEEVDGEQVQLEDVMVESADVLLPSARTWAITNSIAERIQAKAIIPIANAPYAAGVTSSLHERGVLCFPGYLCNGGGVFGSSMYDCGMSEYEVEQVIRRAYRPMVCQLIQKAKMLGASAVDVVDAVAIRELKMRNETRQATGWPAKLMRIASRRLPKRLHAKNARQKFIDNMSLIMTELEKMTSAWL